MATRNAFIFFLQDYPALTAESLSVCMNEGSGVIYLNASGESVSVSLPTGFPEPPLEGTGESISINQSSANGKLGLIASGQSISTSVSSGATTPPLEGVGQSLQIAGDEGSAHITNNASGQSVSVSGTTGSAVIINNASGESLTANQTEAVATLGLVATGETLFVSDSQGAAEIILNASGESVTISHTEAGGVFLGNCYLVYTQVDDEPAALRACLPAGTGEATLTGHPALWDGLVWVLAVCKCGVVQTDPPIKRQAAFDADDYLIGQRPDDPATVTMRTIAAGELELKWTWIKRASKPVPTAFNLYLNIDDAGFDFDAAPAVVVPHSGGSAYRQTLGPYSTGTVVQAVVRPVSALGAESVNLIIVSATADATPPDSPAGVSWEVLS